MTWYDYLLMLAIALIGVFAVSLLSDSYRPLLERSTEPSRVVNPTSTERRVIPSRTALPAASAHTAEGLSLPPPPVTAPACRRSVASPCAARPRPQSPVRPGSGTSPAPRGIPLTAPDARRLDPVIAPSGIPSEHPLQRRLRPAAPATQSL